MYLHGKIGSFLFRMGTIENIAHYSKYLFSVFCSRILAYKHESLFPDIYLCLFLVSITIAELTGSRQNI